MLLLAVVIRKSVRPSLCSNVQSQKVSSSKSQPNFGSGGASVVVEVVVVGVGEWVVVASAGKTVGNTNDLSTFHQIKFTFTRLHFYGDVINSKSTLAG